MVVAGKKLHRENKPSPSACRKPENPAQRFHPKKALLKKEAVKREQRKKEAQKKGRRREPAAAAARDIIAEAVRETFSRLAVR